MKKKAKQTKFNIGEEIMSGFVLPVNLIDVSNNLTNYSLLFVYIKNT